MSHQVLLPVKMTNPMLHKAATLMVEGTEQAVEQGYLALVLLRFAQREKWEVTFNHQPDGKICVRMREK